MLQSASQWSRMGMVERFERPTLEASAQCTRPGLTNFTSSMNQFNLITHSFNTLLFHLDHHHRLRQSCFVWSCATVKLLRPPAPIEGKCAKNYEPKGEQRVSAYINIEWPVSMEWPHDASNQTLPQPCVVTLTHTQGTGSHKKTHSGTGCSHKPFERLGRYSPWGD